jgi:anti-sigma factor RsiW
MSAECREISPELSQLVDGTLLPDAEARVSAHLVTCASCRGVVADLERLERASRLIGPIGPPEHVWLEIAGQIRLADPGRAAPSRPARSPVRQWVGLAAGLVLVTAGLYFVQRAEPDGTPPSVSGTPATGSVEAVADELNLAAEHYERAIAELEAMTASGDGPVAPAVVAAVRTNLGVIDDAIAESRAALASNPQSAPARDSLFDALKRKIDVLQTTVSLINEMRSGDPDGAQKAAEDLRKKS